MKRSYTEPFIPRSLEPYYDEQARLAHSNMAHKTLDTLLKYMPPTQIVDNGKNRVRFAELKPRYRDYNPNEALLLVLPFAQGWKPLMFLRALYLQNSAAPNMRMIIFPGDTLREPAFSLTKEELEKVKNGDLRPIAERRAQAVRTLGIAETAINGYSGGATEAQYIADVLSDYSQLSSLAILEPTNAEERTKKALKKDFQGKNIFESLRTVRTQLKALSDAEVPAVNEALGWVHLIPDYVQFAKDVLFSKANKALQSGLVGNDLAERTANIMRAQPRARVFIGNAEFSRIARSDALQPHVSELQSEFGDREAHLTVEGYGHEMGDQIVVHGLLGKAALSRAKK